MLGYKRLGIPHLIGFYLILSAWVKPRRKLDYYDDEDEEEELLDWVCIFNWFLFSFISFISLIPNLSIEFVLSVLKQICPEMHAVRNQTKLVLLEHVWLKFIKNCQFWLKFTKIFKSMNIHLVWWNFVKSAIFFYCVHFWTCTEHNTLPSCVVRWKEEEKDHRGEIVLICQKGNCVNVLSSTYSYSGWSADHELILNI